MDTAQSLGRSLSATADEGHVRSEQYDIEKQSLSGASIDSEPRQPLYPETDLYRGIVAWDGQEDPHHPQNFPPARKWVLLVLISVFTMVSALASSMPSPALTYMAADLHETNQVLLCFTVSVYLVGYTFGPCILAPLSELYGRRIVITFANSFCVLWQIGCALAPNTQTEVICRFFAGVGGSGCMTLGAAVISDLFPIEQRGKATSIWMLGLLMGPVIGPLTGGFVGETVGWRWIFWVLLITGGTIGLGIEILNQETFAPVLIRWKTERLAGELGRSDLRSAYEVDTERRSVFQMLKGAMMRPLILFCKSPIVLLLSIYMAFIYGLLYLFFTTITAVFTEQYGFSIDLSGLVYISMGLGFLCGLLIIGLKSDKLLIKLAQRNGGKFEPEMRLPLMVFFACICPITFFWYGWSAEMRVNWIVPIIGIFPFGFGILGIFMSLQTYIIDCFPMYAASANATLTATRSFVGALLPLAGPAMFQALGLGWGNSLLGFLAVAFIPVPIIFTRYGKVIRERFPVQL